MFVYAADDTQTNLSQSRGKSLFQSHMTQLGTGLKHSRFIPGTLCHHLSFSLQVLPLRLRGHCFSYESPLSPLRPRLSSVFLSPQFLEKQGCPIPFPRLSWNCYPGGRFSPPHGHPLLLQCCQQWLRGPACFPLPALAFLPGCPFSSCFPCHLILHFSTFSELRPFVRKGCSLSQDSDVWCISTCLLPRPHHLMWINKYCFHMA